MSYLLFMDESGHDHRQMPYEVRGGIVLHASRVWPFVVEMQKLELQIFGNHLHEYGTEIKGEKLLNRDRFKWSMQTNPKTNEPYLFLPDVRRQLSQEFLERGKRKQDPGRLHMTAYGQACLDMVEGTLRLLREQNAWLFATAIPRGTDRRPSGYDPDHLRKDLIYLLERYFYLLSEEKETGLLVIDQIEKTNDRQFGQIIAAYFQKTSEGRRRSEQIVPVPLFVSSDMSYAIQAADLCIYALNWGFRLPRRGMDAPVRQEIADRFGQRLYELQWRGHQQRGDEEFTSYSIVYVPNPFQARTS